MKRIKKRSGALLLAALLLFMQAGTAISAKEGDFAAGLCGHHRIHTAGCGYVEAVPGQSCGHKHTPACYTDGKTACPHEGGGTAQMTAAPAAM